MTALLVMSLFAFGASNMNAPPLSTSVFAVATFWAVALSTLRLAAAAADASSEASKAALVGPPVSAVRGHHVHGDHADPDAHRLGVAPVG